MITDVVEQFYSSFAQSDGDAMAACYADDIVFEDPAFGELRGRAAGDMWRMLCSSATDLTVEHRIVDQTKNIVHTNWIATYTFSATGNKVRNDIDAVMVFDDSKIVEHRDSFSMWKWSSQALGLPGKLFGWSPPLQKKVRSTAFGNLAAFQAAQT